MVGGRLRGSWLTTQPLVGDIINLDYGRVIEVAMVCCSTCSIGVVQRVKLI